VLCSNELHEKEKRVCAQCWSSFIRIQKDDPAFLDLKNKFIAAGVVDDCFSLFLFEEKGKLQEVLHLLKYSGFASLGFRLGEEIGRRLIEDAPFQQADILLPVPLHKLKMRERGYNQSEYICRGISSITKIPVNTSLIKRIKFTATQTKLNLEERNKNVTGAFVVSKRYEKGLEGRKVILVDDVVTTGSTINACARELRKKGVLSVFSASVAHAY
jgi:ComF family protein